MDIKRQIIYGVIYVGVAITFPSLPLLGLKFIGGLIGGASVAITEGLAGMGKDYLKELRDSLFESLNPFS